MAYKNNMTRKKWISELSNFVSENDSKLIQKIRQEEKKVNDFLNNPFKKENGEFIYRIEEPGIEGNLLELCKDKNDVKELLQYTTANVNVQDENKENEWYSYDDINRRNNIVKFKGEIIDISYSRPKIYIYLDSNVARKNNNGYELIERLTKGKGIEKVVLDIIEKEKGNGLSNESEEKIQEMSDLKKQVGEEYSQTDTLPNLDEIISRVFDKHFKNIKKETNPDYANNELYLNWTKKIHNKIKSSDKVAYKNLKADQTLYATALVRNILDIDNKHVVISNDADMNAISEIVYNEILPKYVAETSKKDIEEQYQEDLELKDLEYIAKGLIHIGRKYKKLPNKTIGITYNPSEGKFNTLDFAEPVTHYIAGEKKYTEAKSLTMYELYKVYKENKSGDVRKNIDNKFKKLLAIKK